MDNHTNPRVTPFHLKVSKCDQFGAGAKIIVCHTDSSLPVSAFLNYIEAHSDNPGPFFVDTSHKALTKQKFVNQIRITLNSIDLHQDQYAGNSFYHGAATMATAAGVADSTIQIFWVAGMVQHFFSIFAPPRST